MKKLSLLIAMILCATIGGVYAAWTYALTDDIADAFEEIKISVADAELTGSNGTYKITSNFKLVIDQRDDDHYAELLFVPTGEEEVKLTLTFTPASFAPEAVKADAVPTEFYFATPNPIQYKMDAAGNYDANGTAKDILVFSNLSDGVFSPNVTWGEPDENGVFTVVFNEAQLKEMIKLNVFDVVVDGQTITDTFKLDLKSEHDAFRDSFLGISILARLTDGVVTNENTNTEADA